MQHHGSSMLVPVLLSIAIGIGYLLLALRQNMSPRGWSRWRTALFLCGCGVLILGFSPQLLPFPNDDFRKHMLQHLLVAMLAPIGLVMAAPITLLLRTLPSRYGRIITGVLRSRYAGIIANPAVALVLDLGAWRRFTSRLSTWR